MRGGPVDDFEQRSIIRMMTALEIIEHAQALPEEEQIEIVRTISQKLSNAGINDLRKTEHSEIEKVLTARLEDDCVPISPNLEERVFERAADTSAQVDG
jgi:hypothetical protein